MRNLFIFALCFFSITTYAKPYIVTSETTISNGNWYPLSVLEMKAAAVDTALSEFTSSGRFEIVRDDKSLRQQNDGEVQFDISLIGPAEIVKLTVTLHLNSNVTYVSSVSMDIHGMDYQGIYNAFEYVGTEAAKRLNTKIAMLQAGDKHSEPNNGHKKPSSELVSIFNQAQQLKREGNSHEARVLFEKVIEVSVEADREWSEMATDELRYGLPIFEADNLMLDNKMGDILLVRKKMETVALLYRQILADNTDQPLRVVEMNKRLDGVSITRKALVNALRASTLSRAASLRIMLEAYYMDEGEWPDQATMTQQIHNWMPDFDVVSYQSDKDEMELVVRDIKYGANIQFFDGMQGITMKLK